MYLKSLDSIRCSSNDALMLPNSTGIIQIDLNKYHALWLSSGHIVCDRNKIISFRQEHSVHFEVERYRKCVINQNRTWCKHGVYKIECKGALCYTQVQVQVQCHRQHQIECYHQQKRFKPNHFPYEVRKSLDFVYKKKITELHVGIELRFLFFTKIM